MLIPAIATTHGFRQMRAFYAWCREQRIPVLQCEALVGTTLEPTVVSMKGSRQMLALYEELSANRSGSFGTDRPVTIRTCLLFRDDHDYTLAALYHGRIKRGWYQLVREAMGAPDY